jgi:hypothetical protein
LCRGVRAFHIERVCARMQMKVLAHPRMHACARAMPCASTSWRADGVSVLIGYPQ